MNSLRICWASVLVMTLAGCGGRAEMEGPRGSTSFGPSRDAGTEDPASGADVGSGSAGAPTTSGTGGRGAASGNSGMSQGGALAAGGGSAVAGSSGMSQGGAPVGSRAGQGGMSSAEPDEPRVPPPPMMPTVRPPRMPPPEATMPPPQEPPPEEPPPEEPPPAVPLPPGCMTAYQFASTGSCEHQLYCEDGETYSSCRDHGGGSTSCVCFGTKGQTELTLSGVNMDSACVIAATECQTPTPAGAEGSVCDVVQESAGGGYCSVARECSTEVETSSGGLIRRKTFENADCSASSDAWECSCYDQNFDGRRQIGVVLGSDLAARDACRRASEVCREEPFMFSNDRSCVMEHQSASRDFCDAQLSCRIPGTSGEGTPVHAVSYAQTYCQQSGPDAWSCECFSGEEGTPLMGVSLEAVDSWTACQRSAAECFPEGEF